MLGFYANQTLTFKSLSSINKWGFPSYSSSTIKGRYEYDRKIVRNREGTEVVSEAVCFTSTAVKPDDVITFDGKDWTVISVAEMPDLKGSIVFYEVRL